jgi:hypothetical protein
LQVDVVPIIRNGSIKQAQDDEKMGREEGALDAWCRVFGNDFRRLSQ